MLLLAGQPFSRDAGIPPKITGLAAVTFQKLVPEILHRTHL
jgi:hypothetical protein